MRGWVVATWCLCAPLVVAGSSKPVFDSDSGFNIYRITQGDLVVELVPDAGFNVSSIKFRGQEILKTPPTYKELPGYMFGVPILYPMPNRVRDGKLKVDDLELSFPPNNGPNFLHGIVHSLPFVVRDVTATDESVEISAAMNFDVGTAWYAAFPLEHSLIITLKVESSRITWTYEVNNEAGDRSIPFGIGLHPWFVVPGARKEVTLTIPATHWMEAKELLPTGRLVELAGSKFDARKGKSLDGFLIDDVYFGMKPDRPTEIRFDQRRLTLKLHATQDFTHLVVYTEQPDLFCVENQTCSTDAHNLWRQGFEEESHLQFCPPGASRSGSVTLEFVAD